MAHYALDAHENWRRNSIRDTRRSPFSTSSCSLLLFTFINRRV